LKSFLFTLNLQMDWLLDRIDLIRSNFDPIIWASGTSEIERLTLLLEDRWFFQHSGIDFRAIPRAVRQLVTFKRVGGISTIEQQLVRTILERRQRTLRRKTREMLLAWILSHRLPKRDILRTYLSTAYLGYQLRGCDQAAQLLYSVPSPSLNCEQAAFVASLLVYPLPKVVLEYAGDRELHPIANNDAYFGAISAVAPRWSKRMRRRMAYGLARRRKSK
jgi:membrane carboxypeptidase/penicillin-binding protein PbpC